MTDYIYLSHDNKKGRNKICIMYNAIEKKTSFTIGVLLISQICPKRNLSKIYRRKSKKT